MIKCCRYASPPDVKLCVEWFRKYVRFVYVDDALLVPATWLLCWQVCTSDARFVHAVSGRCTICDARFVHVAIHRDARRSGKLGSSSRSGRIADPA